MYQKKGVFFAALAGRSLITDEMGLGKTLQTLAFLRSLRSEDRGTRNETERALAKALLKFDDKPDDRVKAALNDFSQDKTK